MDLGKGCHSVGPEADGRDVVRIRRVDPLGLQLTEVECHLIVWRLSDTSTRITNRMLVPVRLSRIGSTSEPIVMTSVHHTPVGSMLPVLGAGAAVPLAVVGVALALAVAVLSLAAALGPGTSSAVGVTELGARWCGGHLIVLDWRCGTRGVAGTPEERSQQGSQCYATKLIRNNVMPSEPVRLEGAGYPGTPRAQGDEAQRVRDSALGLIASRHA